MIIKRLINKTILILETTNIASHTGTVTETQIYETPTMPDSVVNEKLLNKISSNNNRI